MSDPKPEDMCQEQAVFERFWPGREPDFVCMDHAQDTAAIFQCLEQQITLRLITFARFPELDEPTKFACTKGHPQEVVVNG